MPEVHAVRCICLGIQQMLAHHAHHHQPPPMYNIDRDLGALIRPQPPQVPRQPLPSQHSDAPHDPAPAPGGPSRSWHGWLPPRRHGGPERNQRGCPPPRWRRSHGQSWQGQQWGPRAPSRPGATGSGTRTWSPTPLAGDSLPLVLEVYRWLN